MAALPFFLSLQSVAQENSQWKVQHINTSDGLSNRFVNAVIQDTRGYTWIGTNFGLNRYDGYRFDVFTRERSRLHSNSIYQLASDVNSHLWIIYKNVYYAPITGIDIIDPVSFRVRTLTDYIGKPLPFTYEDLQEVVTDPAGNIYLLTGKNEIYQYTKDSFSFLFYLPDSNPVSDFNVSREHFIIQLQGSGTIDMYSKEGVLVQSIPTPDIPDTYKEFHEGWHFKCQMRDTSLVFVNVDVNSGFEYVATFSKGKFSPLLFVGPPKHFTFFSGLNEQEQRILCYNSDELFLLDILTGHRELLMDHKPFGYARQYHARDGMTWLGTDNGVYVLSRRKQYFNAFLQSQKPLYSCRSFSQGKDGLVYLLTHGGNFIYDPVRKEIRDWSMAKGFTGIGQAADPGGNIWFAGENHILFKYNPVELSMTQFPLTSSTFLSVWTMLASSSGKLLLGTTEGIWIKELASNAHPYPDRNINDFPQFAKSTIYHILEHDEDIWLSTDNGMFRYDEEKGVLDQIDESDGLPNNNLLFLHIDTAGIFWIATRGGGLIQWNRTTHQFKSYTVQKGLSHDIIYAIYEDNNGCLWMPSDLGLMRFEKQTGICRTFLEPDGIPHEEFNRTSHFKDKEGSFYFGGLNGFVVFNPNDFVNLQATNLPVRLTKFEAINEKTGVIEELTDEVSVNNAVTLSPNTSSFIVHYSILDYDDPDLKRYAYRIEGLNSNWTYVTENFIRINGLRGGDYILHIKGQSSSGQWSENELIFPIIIQKPILARWYSQLGMLLVLGGIVLVVFRRRSAMHKEKLKREMEINQQLRHVDKLKDQFLANTSHELRTPLNGIVGLSESLLENSSSEHQKEDLELIISSGRRLSNLVNDILDFSRLKEHDLQLNLKPLDIRTLGELCLRMNRNLLRDKQVELRNHIPDSIPYCYADENRLQQILQNLVTNAVKFTREGSVTLDAHQLNGMVEISVTDTGIGIEKDKQELIFQEFEQADGSIGREYGGTGLGLSITKYLVELHGGSIYVNSTPGKGSVFAFTIPVYTGDISLIPERDKIVTGVLMRDYDYAAPKLKSQSTTNGDDQRRQILVVDDEPVNLKVLKNHLEHAGYHVTLANDGQEALDLVTNSGPFHLMLLDVMMPRLSGFEVCQKIREQRLLSEFPIIMVTAKNQINDLVEGLGSGANDYIVKPFSRDELLARVKTQLDNYDIHHATNRFVPHEFIHTLGRQSIMDLHRGDMVEKNVHVMFSDIRDYTTLAEDMSPTENFKFVNSLAGKVGPIVKQHHGMINQYLGDTIMMLFLEKADHGIRAGIDILRLVTTYNEQRHAQKRKLIRLGIGLHSGPLMMGIIGDAMRTDAAVISDTVNTASRMEGLTKHFNVNFILSADTLQKVQDREQFNLRPLGKVQAKGKYQSLDVYECFDGDTDEQIRLKKTTLGDFEAGLSAYFEKDMVSARKYFDSVYQANPMDLTAFGFLHRIHHYLVNGLPDNWSGVEVMVAK